MRPRVVVLGAGPAGLAFSSCYGEGSVVLEKSAEPGGLSRSVKIRDGVFDIGGHSFHTPHPEVAAFVEQIMSGKWHRQLRDARIWFRSEMIPYPFQQFYDRLTDRRVVADCHHTPSQDEVARSQNFEEWIINRFGLGLANHFMLPYNRKLWARDLREMSSDWVGQRIVTTITSSRTIEDTLPIRQPLYSDSLVSYPAEGGFGSIFEALARRCPHIEFNECVTHIDIERKFVICKSGRKWEWDRVVSTMPLPMLLQALNSCPDQLLRMSSLLRAVSLKIVMLLIKRPKTPLPQRVYVADPDVPSHKIAFNHTSSPSLSERAHHAVMCEVSYSDQKPCPPDTELIAAMSDWLARAGYLLHRDDVVASQVLDVPLGYPVNTIGKSEIVKEVTDYLSANGIHSIGRFGAWEYVNSDECIRQGIELARELAP